MISKPLMKYKANGKLEIPGIDNHPHKYACRLLKHNRRVVCLLVSIKERAMNAEWITQELSHPVNNTGISH